MEIIIKFITILKKYCLHLWIILGLLFILDIITTTKGLQMRAVEKNQFMELFVENPLIHLVIKLVYLLIIIVGYMIIFELNRKYLKNKKLFENFYVLYFFVLLSLIIYYFIVDIKNILIIIS